jgi:hypothetical protein
LALLLAVLLAPSLSWFEHGFSATSSGGPFQAAAATTGGCGPFQPNAIIQQNLCPGAVFYARDLYQLESDAVNTYLAAHNLPASDAHLIYDYGRADLRNAIRATMLTGLIAIINKPPSQRTPHEQALYNWLQPIVQANEIAEYSQALNEYHRWRNDPCGFKLDADIASQYGLSYQGAQFCASPLNGLFGGPPVPAESYFLAYGLKNSYGAPAQNYPNFAKVVANTQANTGEIFGIGLSAGAVVALGTAGLIAGFSSSVFPLAFGSNVPELVAAGSWVVNSATAAELGVGETVGVFAGTAAIILVAVAIGVSAGMQAFANEQTINDLNNLNNTLTQVTNNKPDLSAFTQDSSGLGTFKLTETFVAQTLPGHPSTAALPVHRPGVDPGFAISPAAAPGSATPSEQWSYQDWEGLSWTAQTSNGWFVQTCNSGASCAEPNSLIAAIHYVDWGGNKWTASRIGNNFVHTKAAPASTDHSCPADEATGVSPGTDFTNCISYVSSSIPLRAPDGGLWSVSLGLKPSFTSPATFNFTVGRQATVAIHASGTPAPTISLAKPLNIFGFNFSPGAGTASLSYTGALNVAGTFQVTLVASNSSGSVTQTVTMHVTRELAITSPATLTGVAGLPVNFLVTTTGDLPIALSIDPAVLQLTGLTFTDHGDGTASITGRPNIALSTSCVNVLTHAPCGITATNATASVVQNFAISLTSPPAPSLVGPANVTFSAGAPNSILLFSSGAITPVHWFFNDDGRAPSWATLHDNGDGTALLSGTPPAGISGSFTFSLAPYADGAGISVSNFTINVKDLPGFLTPSIARFTAGAPGSFEIQTNGPPATDNDVTLPQGLTFTSGNPATITGTPAAGTGGVSTLLLNASDARGTGSQLLALEIDEAPKITSPQQANFHIGVKSSFAVTTLGFPNLSRQPNPVGTPKNPDQGLGMYFIVDGLPASFTASNLNPQGFATGTLTITGTPTAADFGVHNVNIRATNGLAHDFAQQLILNVLQTAIVPSSPGACDGTYTGDYAGDLSIREGQSCTFEGGSVSGTIYGGNGSVTLHGTKVGGDVRLENSQFGSGFDIRNATIKGSLLINMIAPGAMKDQICGTHVLGSHGLTLEHNGAAIQVGGTGCDANTIDANVEILSDAGAVIFDANHIQGSVDVRSSTGATQVFGNTIGGSLTCDANSALTGGNNTAASKLGQCASF